MSFLYGILASLLEKLLVRLFGALRKAFDLWRALSKAKEENKEVKDQMDKAQTEQERKDALKKAAERHGDPP